MFERAKKVNRLAYNFEQFASKYEFPHSIDPDANRAEIGIPESGKLLRARYQFDSSEDGYGWVANIGRVKKSEREEVAIRVMTSKPVRGVTERIIGDRLVLFGSRDGLRTLSDAEIQRGFMDDISRVSRYFRRRRDFLGEGEEKRARER